ncbi:MAG: DUF6624 domain-containing protein [Longimicrobiaceae bacterium]
MPPSRRLRPVALVAAAAIACAPGRAPLSAQTSGPAAMQQAIDALARALKEKDFDLLAPHLDASFHIGEANGDFARSVLRQVVTGGMRVPDGIAVESVTPRDGAVRVATRFAFPEGSREVELVLTPDAKFMELPFFQMRMAASGAPPGGMTIPAGAAAGAPPSNPALRAELVRMMEEDQRIRREIMSATPPGETPHPDSGTVRRMAEADAANLARLREIVDRGGWPGLSQVGTDGSMAAFLIMQHAPPATQEHYLPMLREAAGRRELAPSLLAMIEDRVRLGRGEPQLYGTQLRPNPATGKLEVWNVEDEAQVDERRARVGLPPLADYLRQMGVPYTPPTPPPPPHD